LRNYLINALMDEGEYDTARQQAEAVLQVADPNSREAVIAQLRLAELAVRSGDAASANAVLEKCCPPHVAEIGEEQLTYELLRALVNLRLPEPRPVARDALNRARERYAAVDQRVPKWLEQLGVSAVEQSALGY
jgi:uncharacterized protein HemY